MSEFYVYHWIINGKVEYVGKGKDERCEYHLRSKTHWGHHLQKAIREGQDVKCERFYQDDEMTAFLVEMSDIQKFGRKDLGTGILWNRTNGGEGSSGRKISDETRRKIGQASKGRIKSPETLEKMKNASLGNKHSAGFKHSEETKKKMSKSRMGNKNALGNVFSDEVKAKIGATLRGNTFAKANKGIKRSSETKERMRLAGESYQIRKKFSFMGGI